jgi:hypothetical protein
MNNLQKQETGTSVADYGPRARAHTLKDRARRIQMCGFACQVEGVPCTGASHVTPGSIQCSNQPGGKAVLLGPQETQGCGRLRLARI